MPSKSSQTHPNMLPFLHASSEIIQIQHKSNYICPLNKSTVILSSLHKCYRIYWNRPDPPKQLEFIKNQTTPIKFTKPNSNIPKSIRIHSDLPNRWNRVKSAQINKKNKIPAEPMQINPKRLKSSIQPRPLKSTQTNRNPTRSSNYNEIHSNPSRSTYTERINHRITTNNYRSHKITCTWIRRGRRQRR